MGLTHSKKKPPIKEDDTFPPKPTTPGKMKEGVLYDVYKKHIRPFDLVFFRGNDFMSDIVKFVQNHALESTSSATYNITNDAFTHLGMVVTKEILDDDRLEEGKLYLWESTTSGVLSDHVPNIDGKIFFGAQLRDLDKLIEVYDYPDDTAIAISHLKKDVFDHERDTEMIRERFTALFKIYNDKIYNYNPVSLASSACVCLRPIREEADEVLHTSETIFCSEMIAIVFKELGFLPEEVIPKNVVPMDFFGFDSEKVKTERVPVIIESPLAIVSMYHFIHPSVREPQSLVTLGIDWLAEDERKDYIQQNPAGDISRTTEENEKSYKRKSVRLFPVDSFESTSDDS